MSAVRDLLARLSAGEIDLDSALRQLEPRLEGALGDFAVVDHDRAARCGFAEVVFCRGKTTDQLLSITAEILTASPRVLLTRATPEHAAAVCREWPEATHHERGRALTIDRAPQTTTGRIAVVAAGTADLPVADEVRLTARIMGATVDSHHDIGVAGLHRLQARLPEIRRANVAVAVAGMDGALPGVLAGLLDRPVIAVPTSTGYGASLGGLAPLLTMLNACAAGVAVVNIDNGFGAGYLAAQINRLATSTP